MGDANYNRYLRSPEWREKRKIALANAKNRCQLCNRSKNLEVHHRTYERFEHELPEDLTVLCQECHQKFSNHQHQKKHKFHKPQKSQKKINWDAVDMIDREKANIIRQLSASPSHEFIKNRDYYKKYLRQLASSRKILLQGN